MLDILTDQMIELAAEVTKRRFEFIKRLQKWAEPIHIDISRGKEELEIRYQSSTNVSDEMDLSKIKEEFYKMYEKQKSREIQRGVTLFGPHRDDSFFPLTVTMSKHMGHKDSNEQQLLHLN